MSRETEVAITVELSEAMRWLGADPDQLVPSSWRGDRLYPFFQRLDARSDLLGLVGSYGDELEDEQVLEGLRRWNKSQKSQSRLNATLSLFHRDFLHMMVEAQARFIVIGGQARRHHFGTPTRDLDLWAEDAPALQSALDGWRETYPQYTDDMQLLSRPWVRIWFPDDTCVRVHGTDDVENGIDILTRIADLDFDELLVRAERAKVDDIVVPILAAEDIDRVCPPASKEEIRQQ